MADFGDKAASAPKPATRSAGEPLSESEAITQILNSSKTVAVVGLSNDRMRPSFHVAEYLKSVGYQIIPVNPFETEVLGEKSYERLQDVPTSVDVVEVFRRQQFVPEIVDAAIQIGARCVWMQEGIVHAEAAERARQAGILVIMNRCMLKEHLRRSRQPSKQG
jgi:predicted CoA-binding protein